MTESEVGPGSPLRDHIRAVAPDLHIKKLTVNHEGLANDVVIVNDAWVFRFAKSPRGARILEAEAQILRLAQPHLSIEIPTPLHEAEGVMVTQLIEGDSLTREAVLHLDGAAQHAIARQLGRFLDELHTVPIAVSDCCLPPTLAPVTRESWIDIRRRFDAKLAVLLLPHQLRWAEQLFDAALGNAAFFDYEPVLIHGDLAPYHILYSHEDGPEGVPHVRGVLDFGVAGLGDPATDVGSLITCYGEAFVLQMAAAYPALHRLLPRARFYAQAIEIHWVLLGLETGEDFWFAAHLGGARDIGALR